ncbi:unnamed protein product [Cyprideis torosa]|uniref:Elongation of very long chain fatty acids protein n=1 Tax=Cyprideis torosa TaxID=163714 RepID=A0A7R8WDG6_9CRUS|nr:unnamed protein product [Cyprideis torosa]CAG0893144.1 unnamed protein product [Cyprideis torosa]
MEEFLASGDQRTATWPLSWSPIPVLAIVAVYLCSVVFIPKFMKDRPAYDLRTFLLVFNAFQVSFALRIFLEFVQLVALSKYSFVCQPVDTSFDPLAIRMAENIWRFYISKVIDLVDTVVFLLRKKTSQVTFLHVYHHFSQAIIWWTAVRFAPGGHSFFIGLLNSFVHAVMYSYYFLSSLGPGVAKYLWWKKYLTTLQMVQLSAIIVHSALPFFYPCEFSKRMLATSFFYTFSVLGLFAAFYRKTYILKAKEKIQSERVKEELVPEDDILSNGASS